MSEHNHKYKQGFACPECNQFHDTEMGAMTCCISRASEKFECSICGWSSVLKDEVIKCHDCCSSEE